MKKIKTITLSVNDNPYIVVCRGHVTKSVFNQAFKNEGWGVKSNYRQDELRYEYGRIKNGAYHKGVPEKRNTKPFTVCDWDHK